MNGGLELLESVMKEEGLTHEQIVKTKKWVMHPDWSRPDEDNEMYGISIEYDSKCPDTVVYLLDK